jgi:predicted amidohydrolase YtcJ
MKTRWLIAVVLCLTIALAVGAQVQGPLRAGDVVLRGGWMFDSLRGEVRRNTGIVVRDGSFLEVDANLTGRDLSAARVIDLEDNQYALPGIFDLHAHLRGGSVRRRTRR